jgi:hypothetical protein
MFLMSLENIPIVSSSLFEREKRWAHSAPAHGGNV